MGSNTAPLMLTILSWLPMCSEESGSCYALDIGGTNFRVVYYKLSDKHGVVVRGLQHCTAALTQLGCGAQPELLSQ
jgi:hexokinase